MKKNTNKSILKRFTGSNCRKNIIDALTRNVLIGGDIRVAQMIAKKICITEVHPQKIIIKQGNADNDIYLMFSGKVLIKVNEREVAYRLEGSHFGEISMLDSTTVRSASVIAAERSIIAKISEKHFCKIADKNPILWRRIAIELSRRLRERNRFFKEPHLVPEVFIGSSSEGLKIASAIQKKISNANIKTQLWTQNVFKPSNTTIEDLYTQSQISDFAIIVLTPDDITVSRGIKKNAPRDNAIFELGLFIGSLNRSRTFLVIPKGTQIKIPSDLLGVNCLLYNIINNKLYISNVINKLIREIKILGPR